MTKVGLKVHHGGLFEKTPDLVYRGGRVTTLNIHPDLLSVRDIRDEVKGYGYADETIKIISLLRPNTSMKDGLVPIETDADIHELIGFCDNCNEINLYVDHDGSCEVDEIDGTNDSMSLSSHEDDLEMYDEYDEEITTIGKSQRKRNEQIVLEKEVEKELSGIECDEFDEDLNVCGSISSDEEGGLVKSKRQNVVAYPEFNPKQDVNKLYFEVGMSFIDKNQLKGALENYRIRCGYNVKVQKSDKLRIQCKWYLWASKPKKEASFKIKTLYDNHTCIPYGFQTGERHITCNWVVKTYTEKFRMLPSMRARELRDMIESDINFQPSLALCIKVRRASLRSIIGDYKTDFGRLRDYAWEVYCKNPGSTVKISTDSSAQGDYVFNAIYICLGSLKKGVLEGCRRVLSVDACFMKGSWKGQIYAAIGRDGNDQMYPVAWGIGARENRDTWHWFLRSLQEDLEIQDGNYWTFISDQQKVLFLSISSIFLLIMRYVLNFNILNCKA